MTAGPPARPGRQVRFFTAPERHRALTLATWVFTVALLASLLGLVAPYL